MTMTPNAEVTAEPLRLRFPTLVRPKPFPLRESLDQTIIPPVILIRRWAGFVEGRTERLGEYDAMHENRLVGSISIVNDYYQSSQRAYTANIHCDRSPRIKGAGLATYLLAIQLAQENDLPYTTGDVVSQSAKKIWEIFQDTGMVEVIEPFEETGYSQRGEGTVTHYSGVLVLQPLHT